jgi:hypothetical protein
MVGLKVALNLPYMQELLLFTINPSACDDGSNSEHCSYTTLLDENFLICIIETLMSIYFVGGRSSHTMWQLHIFYILTSHHSIARRITADKKNLSSCKDIFNFVP